MNARLLVFILLTAIAPSQQAQTASDGKHSGSIGEPNLPVATENVCPFEGCSFREWTVEKDTALYSSWKDDRKQVAELKGGEKVQGLDGVYITRQPDRFLVTQPIPGLSLRTGDVILEYAERGEGYADVWMNGKWYRDFDWGQGDDDAYHFTEDNLTLIRKGVKEWWVEVRTATGLTGWSLDDGNFGHMDQLGDGPDDSPSTSDVNDKQDSPATQAVEIPEPQVAVTYQAACPGKGRIIARWKIQREQPYYRFDGDQFVQLGTLWVGEQVNVIDGLDVVLQPDRLLVTKAIPDLRLQADDVILRYGPYRKGSFNLWTKGEWHEWDGLATVEKDGSGCRTQCDTIVFRKGTIEHWVEIVTSTNVEGWVLASRSTNDELSDSGNFTNLCSN